MKYKIKDKGLGTTNKYRPICVKLPPELDKIVRSLPDRSEFLREAIADKLKEKGLI